jgi:hypothetical protein
MRSAPTRKIRASRLFELRPGLGPRTSATVRCLGRSQQGTEAGFSHGSWRCATSLRRAAVQELRVVASGTAKRTARGERATSNAPGASRCEAWALALMSRHNDWR